MTMIDNLIYGLARKEEYLKAEACIPKVSKNSTSGHTGVSYYPRTNCWRVTYRGKHRGFFPTIEEAVIGRAKFVACAPKKARKPRKLTTGQQKVYTSMHAEHQVLRARYRKLLAQPVSLSSEARSAFNAEYEAIRLKHYPQITHAPQDLSSWEARRIAFKEEHELKTLPLAKELFIPKYLGLSAKGQVAQLRSQYRQEITDPSLSDAERKHLRKLLSFHIARVMAPVF